jgi:hypothetical protein
MSEVKFDAVIYTQVLRNLMEDMVLNKSEASVGYLLIGAYLTDKLSPSVITDFICLGSGECANIDLSEQKIKLDEPYLKDKLLSLGNANLLYGGIFMSLGKMVLGGAHMISYDSDLGLSEEDKGAIARFLDSAKNSPDIYSSAPWLELVYCPEDEGLNLFKSYDGKICLEANLLLFEGGDLEKSLKGKPISLEL